MIITRTPVRISFFGGGTDYPEYYLRHGGATLSTTIDKYVYVTVQHLTDYFDHRIKVHYSKVELVNTVQEILIPNVREALRLLAIEGNVEIHLVSDLPARSGLGTSSATTVGVLKALHGHEGRLVSDGDVARQACHVEQEMIPENVGSQDQYASAFGGLLSLEFMRTGDVQVEPLPITPDRMEDLRRNLLLVFTGRQRDAQDILGTQVERTREGRLDSQLHVMKKHVESAIDVLSGSGSVDSFGELLAEAWELKRSLSPGITRDELDEAYQRALAAGSIGGKLLGAGGGGFFLFFVHPDRREAVLQTLRPFREVPFRFEFQGTQTIYFEP